MPMNVRHTNAPSDAIPDWSGVVTVANSTGGTATDQASNLLRPTEWEATHATTLALTGSEVASLFSFNNGLSSTTNAGGVTVGVKNHSFYESFPLAATGSGAAVPVPAYWHLSPFQLSAGMGKGRINTFAIREATQFMNGVSFRINSSGGFSATALSRGCLAIYSQGTGADVTRLESVWTGECAISATRSMSVATNLGSIEASNYLTIGMISQIDTSGGTTSTTITGSGTRSSNATSMAASAVNNLITVPTNWLTGSVMDVVPFTGTLPPGPYWMAQMLVTTSGGAGTTGINFTSSQTYFFNHSAIVKFIEVNFNSWKALGLSTVNNGTTQHLPFYGKYMTLVTSAPSVIYTSDLNGYVERLYWNYVQDTK